MSRSLICGFLLLPFRLFCSFLELKHSVEFRSLVQNETWFNSFMFTLCGIDKVKLWHLLDREGPRGMDLTCVLVTGAASCGADRAQAA